MKMTKREYKDLNKNPKERLKAASAMEPDQLLSTLGTTEEGLTAESVAQSQEEHGENVVTRGVENKLLSRLVDAFINPFTLILMALAFVSVLTDIVWARPEDKNFVTVIIITIMVLISGALRFIQETKSGNAASKLSEMIQNTAAVERVDTGVKEIPMDEIVVGDLVHLSAGDMVPADVRILKAKDLFISQSALTGESEPVEKHAQIKKEQKTLTDTDNLCFMGTTVISGSALSVVINVGDQTELGSMAKELKPEKELTTFEEGVNSVSWVLIRFMLVMVPVVLFVNGFTKGDWLHALMFAISVAVGLTPEMLPMIVTTNLAKGVVEMSKEKVIVKNMNAIQDLGSMDILCTDKTGTLTQDQVVLEYYLDMNGNESRNVLQHAYLNSYFQTGLKNLIDRAILARQDEMGSEHIRSYYTKVDEIPFDFSRRRMSVVVKDPQGETQLITKGAVEEMLKCCSYAQIDGQIIPLHEQVREYALSRSDELNDKGMRVLAVAQKTNPRPVGQFSVQDEKDMVLIGFLAFLDPPKETTESALKALHDHGVDVKILTGDNEKVTKTIAEKVGLEVKEILLGHEMEELTDEELTQKIREITVFAKISPDQKARIVRLLKEDGHTVGFMGDGINDAAAMKVADIGISVDTTVDIAKEAADVILLEKDLNVLEDGIIEGRKTYANMIKYIKMTASSNFGNMFSVLAASAFLPFLPMAAIHLIILNLIYDLTCTAMPWDNVDAEFLREPRKWEADSVSKFMLWFGPISSIFDITTYLVLYYLICPSMTGGLTFHQLTDPSLKALYIAAFQAGWFIESMWTQTLVIHMIRTPKISFVQSRASLPVTMLTFMGIAFVTALPFTPLGHLLGFASLPVSYFGFLAVTVLVYMSSVRIVKDIYIEKYGELL